MGQIFETGSLSLIDKMPALHDAQRYVPAPLGPAMELEKPDSMQPIPFLMTDARILIYGVVV